MNIRIEVAKFEPGPTFENTINEIKDIYLESIASDAMNLSALTYFDENFDPLSMNNILKTENPNLNQNLKGLLMISSIII